MESRLKSQIENLKLDFTSYEIIKSPIVRPQKNKRELTLSDLSPGNHRETV